MSPFVDLSLGMIGLGACRRIFIHSRRGRSPRSIWPVVSRLSNLWKATSWTMPTRFRARRIQPADQPGPKAIWFPSCVCWNREVFAWGPYYCRAVSPPRKGGGAMGFVFCVAPLACWAASTTHSACIFPMRIYLLFCCGQAAGPRLCVFLTFFFLSRWRSLSLGWPS